MQPPANANISRGQFRQFDAQLRGPKGELEADRGFSTNLRTGAGLPAQGYVVAEPGGQSVPIDKYKPSHLPHFVRNHRVELLGEGSDSYSGAWVDPPGVDLDVSRVHRTAGEAFKAMRKRPAGGGVETEQKSAYNIHGDALLYNVHHPVNMERIFQGLR
jgi:hypothetical protein